MGKKFIRKVKETDLLKSKITDSLVQRMREEALKIDFGKIVLNIAPGKIAVEYTRYEVEPAPKNSRDLSGELVTK